MDNSPGPEPRLLQQVKRSSYVSFWIEDSPLFDISGFLKGELEASRQPQLFALSPLSEAKYPITAAEVRWLSELPSDSWSRTAELDIDATRLEVLARQGLVLSDSDDPDLARLRQRHDSLHAQQWHPYAAFYHFMTREREKNAGVPSAKLPDTEHLAAAAAAEAGRFIERHGRPPSPFHHAPGATRVIELPLIEKAGDFYDVLHQRRTVRAFDSATPMKLEDFTVLMRDTFGCHGQAELSPDFTTLHKTSPSGGALQPIEAYPLVLNIESLAVGFYHYDVENHALELVRRLELPAARELAVEICGGQSHAQSAHVMVVLTARFLRNYWKYRQRSHAYGSLLLEAGHFSQTLHLVATELGLGLYFSSIVDGPRIEEVLGLRAQEEGPLAICGCGVKVTDGPDLGLDFRPFVPRETVS